MVRKMFLQNSSFLYMILSGSNEVCDSIIRLLCFISSKDQIWWAAWYLNVIEVRKKNVVRKIKKEKKLLMSYA